MSETTDDSIRASVEAAFASMEQEPAPAQNEVPAESQDVDENGQPRDERGRFAPKQSAEPEAPEPEAPSEPVAQAEDSTDKPVEKSPAVEPPPTWRAADKEMFGKLPPEAKEFVVRRYKEMEADYTHKTQQRAAFIREFEPVRQMFEPHQQVMRERGMSPASLIKGWVETETSLANPQSAAATVAQIMKGYNIDPGAVLQQFGYRPAQQASSDGTPPEPTAQNGQIVLPPEVQQVLQSVVQKVDSFEQRQRAAQEASMRDAATRVQSEIQKFASAVGPDGQPLHPYFAEVEDTMADLAELARRKGGDIPALAELYEQAVYAHPVVRSRYLADQTAAQEAQRQAQERQRAEQARARAAKAQRAAAPVTGAPGTGHGDHRAVGDLSLREQLSRAAADAFGR